MVPVGTQATCPTETLKEGPSRPLRPAFLQDRPCPPAAGGGLFHQTDTSLPQGHVSQVPLSPTCRNQGNLQAPQ